VIDKVSAVDVEVVDLLVERTLCGRLVDATERVDGCQVVARH
jgi:hypothetical protein